MEENYYYDVMLFGQDEHFPIESKQNPVNVQRDNRLRDLFINQIMADLAEQHGFHYVNPHYIVAVQEIDPDEFEAYNQGESE
ncbi:MAG: hypothetical protein OEZ39_20245 [Gammaproteobacteria bacterium]|nr:hypothetical protein [Gammaproteobacteria bacterium]